MIFRPQKGHLDESMNASKVFKTLDEMKVYISESYFGMVLPEDIVLSEDTFSDPRVGWTNMKAVLINKFGKTNFLEIYGCPQCIGYVNLEEKGNMVLI